MTAPMPFGKHQLELLVNWTRLLLLRWRIVKRAALPAAGTLALRILDWFAERVVDKPWTAEASRKIDRLLVDRENLQ